MENEKSNSEIVLSEKEGSSVQEEQPDSDIDLSEKKASLLQDAQAYFLYLLTILTDIIRFPQSDYLAEGTEAGFKEIQLFLPQLQKLDEPLTAQVLLEKANTVQQWLNNQQFFINNQIKACKNYEENKRQIEYQPNLTASDRRIRESFYPYVSPLSFFDEQYKNVIFDFCGEFDSLSLELKTINYANLRLSLDDFKEKMTEEFNDLSITAQQRLNFSSAHSKTPVYTAGKAVLADCQIAYGRILKLVIEQSNAEQFGQPNPSRKFYDLPFIDTVTWVKNDIQICSNTLEPIAVKLKQELQEKLKQEPQEKSIQELRKKVIKELQQKFNEVQHSKDANPPSSHEKVVYNSNIITDLSVYLSFFLITMEIPPSCTTMSALNNAFEEFFQSFPETKEFEKLAEYVQIVDMIKWLKETYHMRYKEYTEIQKYQKNTVIPALFALSIKTNELNQQFSNLNDQPLINNETKAFKIQCLGLFKEVKKEIFDSLYDEKKCTLINKARVNSLIAIHLHLTELFEHAIYNSENKTEVILQLVLVAVMRLTEYPQPQLRLLAGINEIVQKTILHMNEVIIQNEKNRKAIANLNINSQSPNKDSEDPRLSLNAALNR